MVRNAISEATFQAMVEEVLDLCGWDWFHVYDSRRSKPGFPDLICVRGPRVLVMELKVKGRRPSPAQRHWLAILGGSGKVESYLFYPMDWEQIVEVTR